MSSTASSGTMPGPDRVSRARVAVTIFFGGVGLLAGTIISRMPSVRDDLGVSPGQIGTILLVGSLGGLVAFVIVGGLVARLGPLRLLRLLSVGFIVTFALLSGGAALGSPVIYAAGFFVGLGVFEMTMALVNAQAAEVERLVGSAILTQFHGVFSVSMFAGLGVGALAAHASVDVEVHFGVLGAIGAVVFMLIAAAAVVDDGGGGQSTADREGGFFITVRLATSDRRTIVLGLIILAAFTTEVGSANWIPLAVVDDFGRAEAIGSVAYAGVILSQSLTRIVGPRVVDRLGRVATLRLSAVLIAFSSLVFAFAPGFWPVPIVLVVWGAGTAFAFPLTFSAAAEGAANPTARVAAVSAFGTVGGLVVPQLVGLLAEVVEIRKALLLVVVAAAAIFLLAPATRPRDPVPDAVAEAAD